MRWSEAQYREYIGRCPQRNRKNDAVSPGRLVAVGESKRRHKYNAKPGYLDDIYFDSQAEMNRYCELKLMKRAGIIKSFRVHPKYKVSKKRYYEGDFEVIYPDDHKEVEDVKGVETATFKLKADLFREKYPDLKLVIIK